MKKYSLVSRLLSENIVYDDPTGYYADPVILDTTPIDSLSQIYGHDGGSYKLRKWSSMDRRFDRHWRTFSGDPRHDLYHQIEVFFQQNPKAAQTVRDNLSSTISNRGKIISNALPIFYDDNIEGEPWGYMYNGQISPAGRLKASQRFVAKLQSGGTAELEFAEFLKSKGYSNVQVIGGARNPDVVADGLKFECGTGDKKRLWLGAKFPGKMSPGVASRRQAMDSFLSVDMIMNGTSLIPKGVFAVWKATGYDFLVKGEKGNFVAYSIADGPVSVGGQNINNLTLELCHKSKVLQYDGGLGISYKSIDWSNATRLK